ncbi:hypothetical protein [Azorhizobium doebereinerae]|uniref:hypothetical protein n=1 Tax=Azorhizobium doebereinerae TaxID=281091 RepID=UPI00042766E9|nr:hypothetical protein [Azorhizobium doebereinerae]
MRQSSILLVGLVAGALGGAGLLAPAQAQSTGSAGASGVMETSPAGAAVRTYSNGVRVPVPRSSPDDAAMAPDPDTTGSIAPATRRVPDPRTNRNALGCPEIDPLCQGR